MVEDEGSDQNVDLPPPFKISYENEIIWSLSETKLFHFHGIFKQIEI